MDRYQVLAISHSFTYYAAASVQHQHAFVHILDITNQVLHICSHRTEYISFLRRLEIAFHGLQWRWKVEKVPHQGSARKGLRREVTMEMMREGVMTMAMMVVVRTK